jgi:hypothetical protein
MDGEYFGEKYLTKEYSFDFIPSDEYDWVEFMTDDASYYCINGEYLRYLPIAPDGVKDDFASERAERFLTAILGEDTADETIESVSKQDGRITVKSVWGPEILEDMAEDGITSGKFEYVVDAKTHEVISVIGDYSFEDGTALNSVLEISYDTEAPEKVKTFLEYHNQTEDLRNITVVTISGSEKEVSQNVQVPKGLIIGFRYDVDDEYRFDVYNDAACTELYNSYADTDSDITIYIKWAE